MEPEDYRSCGRTLSAQDIAGIRDLIAANPTASRCRLSILVCQVWGWKHPHGQWRDANCRSLMLDLHRRGLITLPPARRQVKNNAIRHHCVFRTDMPWGNAIECSLSQLQPLTIQEVRRTPQEKLVDDLMASHHYLGYTRPIGESLKFLITAKDQQVACITWSSAVHHLGPRDRFIGWTPTIRKSHLHSIAYNTRFLILPWIRVPHLASHILGYMARTLSACWEDRYQHPIHFLETFVDPTRNRGTCYKAANWSCIGCTTGRGIHEKTQRATLSRKDIWVMPLRPDFRQCLGVL